MVDLSGVDMVLIELADERGSIKYERAWEGADDWNVTHISDPDDDFHQIDDSASTEQVLTGVKRYYDKIKSQLGRVLMIRA